MTRVGFVPLVSTTAALVACVQPAPSPRVHTSDPTHSPYPVAARGPVVDDYHGTKVADPYRWLEDPSDSSTRAWIEAQNQLTRAWIDAVPERAAIEERVASLWNHERFGVPFKKGGKYFLTHNDGLQDQAVLRVADALDAPTRVLLDPNRLRADGTISLGETRVSPDGRLLAFALSEAGSDWNTIRVRAVDDGRDLDDVVPWVKFSAIAWSPDSRGFYYSTYPEHDTTGKVALTGHRLAYHRLGTAAEADEVVFARDDEPAWGFVGLVTEDGSWLLVQQSAGTEPKNRVYVRDLRPGSQAAFRPIFDRFDADYDFLGCHGTRFFFRTDSGAPLGRIVSVDCARSAPNTYDVVVPEAREAIESALVAGGHVVVTYLKDASNVARVFGLDGGLVDEIALPGLGAIVQWSGTEDDSEAFFAFTSFTTPTEIWRYDVARREARRWRAPEVAFRPAEYVTEQVWCASQDGTRIPMFVTRKRSTRLAPDTRALLYGYGGFNVPIKPSFSPMSAAWMERGGVWVVATLRGGSEYGRAWHAGGTRERKQNVFDDFIAAAEFLIARGWTSTARLAIHGRSNGGLLVGACLTQRPDLFGAALPSVGVLDMLRYHRFTIGWAWASDYGRSDVAHEFPYLLAYSPLHNLREGTRYPATLVTTGDHDDRVVPAHSFKFAAALQHAQASGGPPVLIRVETRGGHGAGKPTRMQIEEVADELAFLERALSPASSAR